MHLKDIMKLKFFPIILGLFIYFFAQNAVGQNFFVKKKYCLQEHELLGLMDEHGIGTDASMAGACGRVCCCSPQRGARAHPRSRRARGDGVRPRREELGDARGGGEPA